MKKDTSHASTHLVGEKDSIIPPLDTKAIPTLSANLIGAGVFEYGRLPTIAAALVGTGILEYGRLPTIAAALVGTGVFEYGRLPTIAAALVGTGVFEYGRLPTVAAGLVGTGILGYGRIPTLDASNVGTGILNYARIPTLDATNIGTGILNFARIPTLDASNVGTGILNFARIPTLDATNVGTGILNVARIPTNTRLAGISMCFDTGTLVASGAIVRSRIPFACTILRSTLYADAQGSLMLNWKSAVYASYPVTVVIGTIPLANAQNNQDNTLTGWTTAIAAGDTLEAYVLAQASGVNKLIATLDFIKT